MSAKVIQSDAQTLCVSSSYIFFFKRLERNGSYHLSTDLTIKAQETECATYAATLKELRYGSYSFDLSAARCEYFSVAPSIRHSLQKYRCIGIDWHLQQEFIRMNSRSPIFSSALFVAGMLKAQTFDLSDLLSDQRYNGGALKIRNNSSFLVSGTSKVKRFRCTPLWDRIHRGEVRHEGVPHLTYLPHSIQNLLMKWESWLPGAHEFIFCSLFKLTGQNFDVLFAPNFSQHSSVESKPTLNRARHHSSSSLRYFLNFFRPVLVDFQ